MEGEAEDVRVTGVLAAGNGAVLDDAVQRGEGLM